MANLLISRIATTEEAMNEVDKNTEHHATK